MKKVSSPFQKTIIKIRSKKNNIKYKSYKKSI